MLLYFCYHAYVFQWKVISNNFSVCLLIYLTGCFKIKLGNSIFFFKYLYININILLLGIWSYIYLFRDPCCSVLNFYFALWIVEMFDNLSLSVFIKKKIIKSRLALMKISIWSDKTQYLIFLLPFLKKQSGFCYFIKRNK